MSDFEGYGHALPGIEPLDREFGKSRGEPIDGWYVNQFLRERRADVRGRTMEVGSDPTLIGDLETGEGIPAGAFDCIVLTQTLHLIFDVRSAIRVARDALVPGGVLLATLPGISQVRQFDRRERGDHWRFTSDSARLLFGEAFGKVELEIYGNVLVAAAFLYGYALEDLSEAELVARDPQFPFLIGVRAARD
jgi:SAM-dependent methyltransferase